MDTNDLVKLARQGDAQAFGQIYDQFVRRIFSFVILKIQNRQEAEDIVQEVFVKAYKGLDSLRMEDLNFSAWLYRVASNTINDYFRRKYRTPEIFGIDENFDAPSSYSVEVEATLNSDLETIKKAMVELSPLHKQVLELRFIQDFTLDEVAKILNKSNLSVRLLQFRALKKVKLILEKHHYDI